MNIRTITVREWSLPLVAPFRVAQRTAYEAGNVLVQVFGDNSQYGCGAAAPVNYITGETQEGVLRSLGDISEQLVGMSVDHLTPLLQVIGDLLPNEPAARAAVEMAIYDLWGKRWNIPLWEYFGGAHSKLRTDVTVPIVTPDEARKIVRDAIVSGFDCFKIKIGDSDGHDADYARIAAVVEEAPGRNLRIDANQAFTAEDAVSFVKNAQTISPNIQLVEQPVAREDFDGLRYVKEHIDLPLFADESARTYLEAKTLIRCGAVDGINIKLMKSGIREAVDIVALCQRNGIRLMVGCMLESPLGLAAAAAVAAGTGSFDFVDLDSHVLLKPVKSLGGSFSAIGPLLSMSANSTGWGVTFDDHSGGTNSVTEESESGIVEPGEQR